MITQHFEEMWSVWCPRVWTLKFIHEIINEIFHWEMRQKQSVKNLKTQSWTCASVSIFKQTVIAIPTKYESVLTNEIRICFYEENANLFLRAKREFILNFEALRECLCS